MAAGFAAEDRRQGHGVKAGAEISVPRNPPGEGLGTEG